MKKIAILFALFLLFAFLALPASALGDDVDFGGDDWGGDDWGGDDWGDDDWGDDDWGGDDWGGGVDIADGPTFIVVIIIAVIVFRGLGRKQQGGSAGQRSAGTATRRPDPASIQALMKQDPNFSAADIEAKVKNWVMMFENAWCSGDMISCRPFISDGLYNSYQTQLDMMKRNGEASRTEDLAVIGCTVERWVRDGDKEYLDVWLHVKKRTYKVDINNPANVIKGDRQTTYNLEYRWQLMRSAGEISDNAGIRVAECPNCGAQTSVNQSGKCAYCGSTLAAESFDWVLNKVDKLAQRSHR